MKSLKKVPSGNKGLSKLPTSVRNKMGYMKDGGTVKKGKFKKKVKIYYLLLFIVLRKKI